MPKFSLQSVLDYRHTVVEMLEVELSQLQAALQQARETLAAMQGFRQQLFEMINNQKQGDLDLEHLNRLHGNIRMVERQIERQQQRIEELADLAEAKRLEVVKARQDEEALHILKRKEQERTQAKLDQQETRMQDDIYISQAFRRTGQLSDR